MAGNQLLKNPPIKETIFAISFGDSVEFSEIQKFSQHPTIASNFPTANKGFQAEVKIDAVKPPESEVRNDGLLLRGRNDYNRILHVRRGQISFHGVKGYIEFNDFLGEFISYWGIFEQEVGKRKVTSLSVRYLNEIERTDGETIEDVVKIFPKHPFGNHQKISSFVNLRFRCNENPNVHANVVSTTVQKDSKNIVILDIILTNKFGAAPSTSELKAMALTLRDIKNDIFYDCITDTTIERYNQ